MAQRLRLGGLSEGPKCSSSSSSVGSMLQRAGFGDIRSGFTASAAKAPPRQHAEIMRCGGWWQHCRVMGRVQIRESSPVSCKSMVSNVRPVPHQRDQTESSTRGVGKIVAVGTAALRGAGLSGAGGARRGRSRSESWTNWSEQISPTHMSPANSASLRMTSCFCSESELGSLGSACGDCAGSSATLTLPGLADSGCAGASGPACGLG
mmetsp:Transcript_23202/g.54318  ORF Transcript_23202/g.54318 Transcript_23202/m.54318 type:complete len:207 (+) Transcript_23202:128-748(+)